MSVEHIIVILESKLKEETNKKYREYQKWIADNHKGVLLSYNEFLEMMIEKQSNGSNNAIGKLWHQIFDLKHGSLTVNDVILDKLSSDGV